VPRITPEPPRVAVPEPPKVVEPKPPAVLEKPVRPDTPERPELPKKPEKPVEVVKVVPPEPVKVAPPEKPKVVEPKVQARPEKPEALKVPPVKPEPSVVREEEVRQFFVKYIERYNQRDIDGFLSFFSPQVMQNQKDSYEGIKKIYTNFFEQTEELRYHMADMKIEPHQKGLEVKAHYELEGILKRSGEKRVWKGEIRWVLVREKGVLKILSLDFLSEKTSR